MKLLLSQCEGEEWFDHQMACSSFNCRLLEFYTDQLDAMVTILPHILPHFLTSQRRIKRLKLVFLSFDVMSILFLTQIYAHYFFKQWSNNDHGIHLYLFFLLFPLFSLLFWLPHSKGTHPYFFFFFSIPVTCSYFFPQLHQIKT